MDVKKGSAVNVGIKWLVVLLFLVLSVSMIPSRSAEAASKKSIKLNTDSKSMTVGSTYTLKATVKGDSSKVTWKSSKPSVASVNSKGKVSAKKAGTATITAKANGKTAKCKVTVKKASSKDVTSKYKTKVSKMLGKFDDFLGIDLSDGAGTKKFPFNDYTKTSMLAYIDMSNINGKSVSSARSKLSSKMKLYFGGSKSSVKFKSISASKYPYLFGKRNNKVYYQGGNYGEAYCYGKVSKITKKGSLYYATYKIYIGDYEKTGWEKVKSGGTYLGTYRVTLKKASNKYGFIIKNMERLKVA